MQQWTRPGNVAPTGLTILADTGKVSQFLLSHRLLACSRLDGQPLANGAIGSIQRKFTLSDQRSLLETLVNLVAQMRVGASAITQAPGMRADRAALNNSEAVAYIEAVIATGEHPGVTSADKVFITTVMIAFETDVNAWTLYVPSSAEESIHTKMAELYKFVLRDASPDQLSIVDETGKVISLEKYLGRVKAGPNDKASSRRRESIIKLTRWASCLQLDHIYNLLMSKDIWGNFVSPGFDGKSPSANVERGKTLYTFATYLEQIINIPNMLKFEAAMEAFDAVEKWSLIPTQLSKKMETQLEFLRKMDLIGVRKSTIELLSNFRGDIQLDGLGQATCIPDIAIETTNLVDILDSLQTLGMGQSKFKDIFSNVNILTDSNYVPILTGQEVGETKLTYSATQALAFSDSLKDYIESAAKSMLMIFERADRYEIQDRVRSLNLSTHLTLTVPVAGSWKPTIATKSSYGQGVIYCDSTKPNYTRDYKDQVREILAGYLFVSTVPHKILPVYRSLFMILEDDRKKLSEFFPQYNRTLGPSSAFYGDYLYNSNDLASSAQSLHSVLEMLTGSTHADYTQRLMTSRNRRHWATLFSSFMTLYVVESELNVPRNLTDVKIPCPENAMVVVGYGKPFGLEYEALALKASKPASLSLTPDASRTSDPECLIAGSAGEIVENSADREQVVVCIMPGLWAKIHRSIPLVSDAFVRDEDFIMNEPHCYFAGNGESIPAGRWVMTDPMWQHAMAPAFPEAPIQLYTFTRHFFYTNMSLYMNAALSWSPTYSQAGDMTMSLHVEEKAWPGAAIPSNAKHIVFGPYTTATVVAEEVKDQELIDLRKEVDAQAKAKALELENMGKDVQDPGKITEELVAKELQADKKEKGEIADTGGI